MRYDGVHGERCCEDDDVGVKGEVDVEVDVDVG